MHSYICVMKNTRNALVSKPETVHWFYLDRHMYFINSNIFIFNLFHHSFTIWDISLQLSVVKKISTEILSLWETSPTCHRISLRLDNAPLLLSQKRWETPFSLLWVKRQISLRRAGCDYAFRKEQKKKSKKKRGEGEIMTKASHCSSSSTLELVVHRLACAGCGWGCPALGPVWKQIFQVSAGQKWMRTITRLSIVNMNEAIFAWTAWEFSRFSSKEKKKTKTKFGSLSAQKSACWAISLIGHHQTVFFCLFFVSSSILVKLRFLAQNKTLMTAASDERDLLPFYGKRKFDFIFLFLPRPVAFSCFPSSLLSEPTGFATVHCCCCFTMTNHNVARPVGPCVTFSGWP